MLSQEMKDKIKLEINNDPKGRGYAGKSAQEQSNLLNASFDVEITTTRILAPRISTVLASLPEAPNTVSAADVNEALT